MNDLTKLAEADSTQLNAIDFIGGAEMFEIASVKVVKGEQPVEVSLKGVDGKVYRPCKSMIRVMITAWGKDADLYKGKKFELFNDDSVTWAGGAVGGIRIAAMTDIQGGKDLNLMLTVSRGKKKPYKVKLIETKPKATITEEELEAYKTELELIDSMAGIQTIRATIKKARYDKESIDKLTPLFEQAKERIQA